MSRLKEYIKKYEDVHTGTAPLLLNGKPYYSKPGNEFFSGEQSLKYFTKPLKRVYELKKKAITVLDYGCGRGVHMHTKERLLDNMTTLEYHKGNIQCYYLYDPCVPMYNTKPATGSLFDVTICADVLEHVPEEDLDSVLKEMSSYTHTNGVVMFSISSIPAVKSFSDGENVHITLKSEEWWTEKIASNVAQTFLLAYKAVDAKGRTKVRNTPSFTL